jgi:magnesium transporter
MAPSSKLIKTKGLPPGTPIYTGDVTSTVFRMEIFCYDEYIYERTETTDWDEIKNKINAEKTNWININSISNVELIEKIGAAFNFHALLLEDILTVDMLPKLEQYDDHLLFCLKMLSIDAASKNIKKEQISFVLGKHYLISFQEYEGDVFLPIRDRIIHNKGRVRRKKADYLLMALIDVVVDNYLPVLEELQQQIELLEEQLLNKKIELSDRKILMMRKQMGSLMKSILPAREAVRQIIREEPDLIEEINMKYYRDIFDHLNYITATLEGFKDDINGLTDLYNATINNRLNNIMKTLTIISSIFIPLSFIAGIYGMNFDYMPELRWQYGYFMALGIMGLVGITMTAFMIRKKWL